MNLTIMDRKHRATVVDSLLAKTEDADLMDKFKADIGYIETPEMLVEQYRAAIAAEHSQRIHHAVTVRRGRVPDPGDEGVAEHYNQSVQEAVEEARGEVGDRWDGLS